MKKNHRHYLICFLKKPNFIKVFQTVTLKIYKLSKVYLKDFLGSIFLTTLREIFAPFLQALLDMWTVCIYI